MVLGFEGGGEEGFDCQPLGPLERCWSLRRITRSQLSSSPTTCAQHAELVVRDSSPDFELTSKPSFMGSRNIVYLSDFFSKRAALIDGAGYGWIPYHFVRDDLDAGTLTLLKAESNRWTYHPQLIVREGHELGRAGRLFVETLSPPLAGRMRSASGVARCRCSDHPRRRPQGRCDSAA